MNDSKGIRILNLSCNPLLPSWEVVASITAQLPKLASLDLRYVQRKCTGMHYNTVSLEKLVACGLLSQSPNQNIFSVYTILLRQCHATWPK